MEVLSHYGMGMKAFAIERKSDGRVEFTLWMTVFWMPVFPQSSWSAYYVGPSRPDGIKEDGHRFCDAFKIHRGVLCYIRTVALSLLTLVWAIVPIGYFICRTAGRAATTLEMIFIFAACVWPVGVITLIENLRTKLLKGN